MAIAFERATEIVARSLAFFRDESRPEPTDNEKILAGHLVGALWANDLLNTGDEKWTPVKTE